MIRNVPGARPVSDRARTWAGETNRRAGRRRGRTARPRDGGRAAERAAGGHPLGHPAGRLPPKPAVRLGAPRYVLHLTLQRSWSAGPGGRIATFGASRSVAIRAAWPRRKVQI